MGLLQGRCRCRSSASFLYLGRFALITVGAHAATFSLGAAAASPSSLSVRLRWPARIQEFATWATAQPSGALSSPNTPRTARKYHPGCPTMASHGLQGHRCRPNFRPARAARPWWACQRPPYVARKGMCGCTTFLLHLLQVGSRGQGAAQTRTISSTFAAHGSSRMVVLPASMVSPVCSPSSPERRLRKSQR